MNQQHSKFHISHTKNSEFGLPKNRIMCLYTLCGASSSPSGQHSVGGKMNVVVGDAHGLSVNIFTVALTNANIIEQSISDFY